MHQIILSLLPAGPSRRRINRLQRPREVDLTVPHVPAICGWHVGVCGADEVLQRIITGCHLLLYQDRWVLRLSSCRHTHLLQRIWIEGRVHILASAGTALAIIAALPLPSKLHNNMTTTFFIMVIKSFS